MAHPNTPETDSASRLDALRAQLAEAQAAERRTRALLEAVASLVGSTDTDAVLSGIAENAVRHIGLPSVAVYGVDHQSGTIRRVALAELDARAEDEPLPGMAQVRLVTTPEDPVRLGPGDPLAEFALGDEQQRLTTIEDADGGTLACVLTQMRCGAGSHVGATGALVGLLVACAPHASARHQMPLLRALAVLGATAAETARVERLRTQLVSAVSHELRTPLAAIRAYNELLLDGDAGPINDEQRLFLERIELTCLQLDRMVEDMLDLSRLRAGEMVVPRQPVDVLAVIEHIIDTLSPEAARRGVTVREDAASNLPQISSNADRLAQVLFNLVGNAVKYVGAGGEVVVRALVGRGRDCAVGAPGRGAPSSTWGDACCLIIEVADNGPGIAPEDIDRIFEEFYRGRLTEGEIKGSGLGLAIATRLTGLLGGELSVESTPGEGSTFRLLFPIPPPDARGGASEEVSRCAE